MEWTARLAVVLDQYTGEEKRKRQGHKEDVSAHLLWNIPGLDGGSDPRVELSVNIGFEALSAMQVERHDVNSEWSCGCADLRSLELDDVGQR
jgi:hypothetical protein